MTAVGDARKRLGETETALSRPASPQPTNSPSDALGGAQGVEAIRRYLADYANGTRGAIATLASIEAAVHPPMRVVISEHAPDGAMVGDLAALLAPAPATEPLDPAAEVSLSPKAAQSPASETASGECASCGEGDPVNECPKSQRPCGHHCNHIWEVDACDWCGYEATGDTSPAPTPPTTVQADRDAGQVRPDSNLAEKWTSASIAARKAEHHWPADCLSEAVHVVRHLAEQLEALAARQSDPDATERVEWGVRGPEGLGDDRMVIQGRDEVETRTAFATYWAFSGGTLVRRTVTTGEWTEVGE